MRVAASFVGWGSVAGATSTPTGTGGSSVSTGGGALTTSSATPAGTGTTTTATSALTPALATSALAAASTVTSAQSIVGIANASASGYWEVATDGGVFSFNAPFYGSMGGKTLAWPIAGMAATPDHAGYWLYGLDGGVFTFGDAHYYGSEPEPTLKKGWQYGGHETVALVPTQDGKGYWEINASGSVYTFGDAHYYGTLATPDHIAADDVVSATNWGDGYAMLQATGALRVFTSSGHFGHQMCSACNTTDLQAVSIAATSNDAGVWVVDVRGQVFTYGNATYQGGATSIPGGPINAISGWGTAGYRFAGLDGGVFDFKLSYEGRAIASSEQGSAYAKNVAIEMLPKGDWGRRAQWTTGLKPLWQRESGWEWTVCAGGDHYPNANCTYNTLAYGIAQADPGPKYCYTTSTQPPCPSPTTTTWHTHAWTQMYWGFWYIDGHNGDYLTPTGRHVLTPITANEYDTAHKSYVVSTP